MAGRDPATTIRRLIKPLAADLHPHAPRNTLVALADILYRRTLDRRRFDLPETSDAAWLMLLVLVLAEDENNMPAVSTLCRASGAPRTTALRQLLRLEDRALVARAPDPRDRRRTRVALTERGRAAMIGELAALHAELRGLFIP